ncbi:MAG TPA: SMI1/KNR4 family protein [Micromonosporaceae bacterium]|jgi:hypothetical protein
MAQPYPVRFTYAKKIVPLPPATADQLAVVETAFGPLPSEYRRFLSTVNGGAPVPCFLDFPSRHEFEIECFYGVGAPSDAYSVEYRSASVSERMGQTVVAIAGDGFGDQLILLRPGDPAVYQWVHDEQIPPIRMAPSFPALLAALVPAPKDPDR